MTDDQLHAVLWAALGKIASRELRREQLPEGTKHELSIEIDARVGPPIGGHKIELDLPAVLSIGHSCQSAASVAPDAAELLAYVLSQLNSATRMGLLRRLPEMYSGGKLTQKMPAGEVNEVKDLLKRIRGRKTILRAATLSVSG
jgi:hypothetical protein